MCSQIMSKLFAHEEIESDLGYFSGYKGPGSIADQLAKLRKFFPQIGGVNEELVASIERGDVKLSNIPKRFPEEDRHFWCIPHWTNLGVTYDEAIIKVLEAFGEKVDGAFGERIYDADDMSIHPTDPNLGDLKQTKRKIGMMNQIMLAQDADILIIEAQFGLRHRGRSVRRARVVMSEEEFGLGIYEILMMLLLSPERLADRKDLRIDAAGDEWQRKSSNGRRADRFAHFSYGCGDAVHLCQPYLDMEDNNADKYSGSASAFIVKF